MSDAPTTYDYRRGAIEVIDRSSGSMRCSHCGARWQSNIRDGSNGQYYRGSWTWFNCGANTKNLHAGRLPAGEASAAAPLES